MKNFKIFSFLLLFFTPLLSFAQTNPGDTLWAKSTTSGSEASYFFGVATDSNSSYYGAGYIWGTGTFNFGDGVTVSGPNGGSNILLVKYNSSGTTLWAKSLVSASDNSNLNGVATDSDGNVYVVGRIYGNSVYNLGNGVTVSGSSTSNSYSDIFVAKYDSNGNALWAKSTTSGPNWDSELLDVVADSDGNVYVAGYMRGTDTYGFGDGITAAGSGSSYNIILIKYDTNGTTKWVKTVSGSTNNSELYGVALDNYGDPYVSGRASGITAFNLGDGVSVAAASGSYSIFLAKYNSTGNAQWAKSTTSAPDSSNIRAIALDNNGNIFASGYLDGSGTYGLGNGVNVNASYNGYNALLLKYNSTGHAQWAKNPTIAPNKSRFDGVTVDSLGNIYATGYTEGTGQFDFGNDVTAKGVTSSSSLVLVNYDNDGNAVLAKGVSSGTSSSKFYKTTINNATDIYTVGYISGNNLFNLGNDLNVSGSNGGYNAVIVKYHGNYTIPPESSSSSSSSSNAPVASDASSMKHRLPKLFAVGGAILLLF